jgi:hypothetical protein
MGVFCAFFSSASLLIYERVPLLFTTIAGDNGRTSTQKELRYRNHTCVAIRVTLTSTRSSAAVVVVVVFLFFFSYCCNGF